MKYRIFIACGIFILFQVQLLAQTPQVPSVIQFADMTLKLNEHARREIQQDVNALYRSPTHFQMKLDRVNLYMPTVERVLREQGVPTDLKYLVIQESSLIPDAVSTSNAVGFWQFKKGTAEEVFMRVDNQIDERKNIVSSTRGAATYLKKHHNHLDNWVCTLVSYQMGLGGARGYFGDKYKGKRTMEVDKNTHWYFKKFLAHKVAFEGRTTRLVSDGGFLHEYSIKGPTNLASIAKNLGVSENHLKEFNKWTSNGQIPGDRTYVITYIQQGIAPSRPVLTSSGPPSTENQTLAITTTGSQAYPKISGNLSRATSAGEIRVNNIKGVMAQQNGSVEELSNQTGIRKGKLRRVNDLKKSEKIQAGNYYYTKRKKGKAEIGEHIVQPGETLWEISQTYGIRLHSLKAKNRLYKDSSLKPGMVLKLRDYRKRNEDIKMVNLSPQAPGPRPAAPQARKNENKNESLNVSNPTNQTSSNSETPSDPLEHVVQAGDTLYAISRKHGVTVDQLRIWNNLGGNNLLSVGQKIIIKK